MQKRYFPLVRLLELELLEHYHVDSPPRSPPLLDLLEYSRTLLQSMPRDVMSAVVHMDSILQEKLGVSSLDILPLLDSILSECDIKLLESNLERRARMQSQLIALRSCYLYEQRRLNFLRERHPRQACPQDFRDLLARMLGTCPELVSLGAEAASLNVALCALRCVAHELMTRDELDPALALYTDILERQQMVLGEGHADSMVTTIGICDVIARQGQVNEARERFEQVVERKKLQLGSYHPETLAALGAFAFFLSNLPEQLT